MDGSAFGNGLPNTSTVLAVLLALVVLSVFGAYHIASWFYYHIHFTFN